MDPENNRIQLNIYLPKLEMTSDYIIKGNILMLPIKGNGRALANFTDIDAIMTIQGERYLNRRTNKIHFRVREFHVDLNVGDAAIRLENLFGGDVKLSKAMHHFINENWKSIAAEVKPELEDIISSWFKTFSYKFYSKYPLDALLPP